MANWFECKVTYEKVLENGMHKRVTEPYLVDALSFTEAEARIIKEITPSISGEFEVKAVGKKKIAELFPDGSADRWYQAKVFFVTGYEKNGMEKKTATIMMIQASDIEGAMANLKKGMTGTMEVWEVASITETSIMDIFPFEEEN